MAVRALIGAARVKTLYALLAHGRFWISGFLVGIPAFASQSIWLAALMPKAIPLEAFDTVQ